MPSPSLILWKIKRMNKETENRAHFFFGILCSNPFIMIHGQISPHLKKKTRKIPRIHIIWLCSIQKNSNAFNVIVKHFLWHVVNACGSSRKLMTDYQLLTTWNPEIRATISFYFILFNFGYSFIYLPMVWFMLCYVMCMPLAFRWFEAEKKMNK